MKPKSLFVLPCLLMFVQCVATADTTVSNARASQRAGTQLVDIYYDLASASNALMVSVTVSTNGGASYTLPATSFTGAVGAGIAPGTNQKITWNAGADWPGQYSANVRFRVTADDANAPSGMALIPAGSFTMGDTFNEGYSDELPLHAVYVSAFYMDKYDVTEALWQQVYNWATNHGYSFDDPGSVYDGYTKGPNYPVVYVDWYDCVKWCNARSEMEGRTPAYYTDGTQTTVYRTGDLDISNSYVNWSAGYRLPTEAEWEKAARGGMSGQRFPWGNTINESQANYYSYWSGGVPYYSYDVNSYSGYNTNFDTGNQPYTSPVNYFAANGYGLYDMAGNVWQWCWDWYDPNWYGNAGATQSDTRGPASSPYSYRLLRGGSWFYNTYGTRCAQRGSNYPNFASYYLDTGFRCVLPHSGLPTVTIQPLNTSRQPGFSVTFTATAIGNTPMYYQWQENGSDLVSATGASLTLTNLQLGVYFIDVVVNNGVGTAISPSAELDVVPSSVGEQ